MTPINKILVHKIDLMETYNALCKLCSLVICLLLWLAYLQDNKDLYAEEAAVQREKERQRMLAIPGLIAPSELQDEMVDSQCSVIVHRIANPV